MNFSQNFRVILDNMKLVSKISAQLRFQLVINNQTFLRKKILKLKNLRKNVFLKFQLNMLQKVKQTLQKWGGGQLK